MTPHDTPSDPILVGIDVTKDKLDLARSDSSDMLTVANDGAGIDRIVRTLREAGPA